MKRLIYIFLFLLIFNTRLPASDYRISAVAKTKHEAYIKAQAMLPSRAVINKIYYSGAGNRFYCFIAYSFASDQ